MNVKKEEIVKYSLVLLCQRDRVFEKKKKRI